MPWSPAVPMYPSLPPPALAAATAGSRMNKKRAGLPKLLHKLFIKVLRLKPVEEEPTTAFEAYYGAAYRMGMGISDEDDYCYCYSYGSSWAGVLSSIPEEEDDTSSSDDEDEDVVAAPAAVLRKAKSERFVVRPPDAGTVVHVGVLL